jgi:hypothetical protein
MNEMTARKIYMLLPIALSALVLSASGKKPAEETVVTTDPAVQEEIDESAELKAREEELKRREAELALKEKEKELADREAALAKASAPKPAPKPASKPPAVSPSSPAPKPAPVPVVAGPKDYTVPAGTSVSVQLPAEISTKTAKVGQRFTANLSSDVVVDGKVLARAGAPVQGSIAEVISGSNSIGGKPTLVLAFDNMTFTSGDKLISGRLKQVADKSDKGRDTAKIAGGAVAGGVIGHQIDSDQGKAVGAVLGALAGTAAAKKTGQEVVLPAGTVVGFTLDQSVTVTQ